MIKLNYRKKVFHFALNFLSLEFLLIKKLDFEKTKATQYTTFKTDIIKVGLIFSISNFFTNKIPREGNWVRFSSVFLPIPKKSNEYRYLKYTAVSILILNVEKYCGQYQYPVKYWSIFKYQYQYFFLKHTLLLTFNMYVKNKYLIFIFWSDHVWQLDEVESFLHKDWLLHLVLLYKY